MKALKYFSYLILGLFLVFVLIGQLFGKLLYTNKITINKPVEKSWSVLTDRSKMGNWVKNFKSIELLNGDQSTKYKLIVVDGGEEYEIIETLIESVTNEIYTIKWENDVLVNKAIYQFSSDGNGTIIEVSEELEGKGFLMKPIFVFMQEHFQSETHDSLERFKTFVESH